MRNYRAGVAILSPPNLISVVGVLMPIGIATACRMRLRLAPMALKPGCGGERYTPMGYAIIGGHPSSVLLAIFIMLAAYVLVYGKKNRNAA